MVKHADLNHSAPSKVAFSYSDHNATPPLTRLATKSVVNHQQRRGEPSQGRGRAVARGELPLGYTRLSGRDGIFIAVARGELPLGYTLVQNSSLVISAVARGELPLGYTTCTANPIEYERSATATFQKKEQLIGFGFDGACIFSMKHLHFSELAVGDA